jgi:hypothetical protein
VIQNGKLTEEFLIWCKPNDRTEIFSRSVRIVAVVWVLNDTSDAKTTNQLTNNR